MDRLPDSFRLIIRRLIHEPAVVPGFGFQFKPGDGGWAALPRNLNAAFLLALGGGSLSRSALDFLSADRGEREWSRVARFYLDALKRIEAEAGDRMSGDQAFRTAVLDLARCFDEGFETGSPETMEGIRRVFFPEGKGLPWDRAGSLQDLRQRRSVKVCASNRDYLRSPHAQVLFTANVLLTVPLEKELERVPVAGKIREAVRQVLSEDQLFWYDHPIPIGVAPGKNEAVYGLRGLDAAVRFEIGRGTAPPEARIPVLLSVSVTHKGLHPVARPWLRGELRGGVPLEHLDIYAVTEDDARKMVREVLAPAARHYLADGETGLVGEVFGVDGEYGRHYSFLKAAAALWQVVVDENTRASFKIDLDQVFPQEEMVAETGRSAFEHLSDPLWGAEGTDSDGAPVRLGMLAGALVDEADIGEGLFTPDVKWPQGPPEADRWIFDSALTQALSTEAEMMARYSPEGFDGQKNCLQRVHVTGGMTGILVEDLRRYRPFTPPWIGRAEDQAYLLSTLFTGNGPALRYVHRSGLFMRHDKKSFAGEAIEASRVGKTVGDYVRILLFSAYARAFPWGIDRIKSAMDPFSGCFISKIPLTVSTLRLALKAAWLFGRGSEKSEREAGELVSQGCARLAEAAGTAGDPEVAGSWYRRCKEGWDLYYDTLDALERGLQKGDAFARRMRRKALGLVREWIV